MLLVATVVREFSCAPAEPCSPTALNLLGQKELLYGCQGFLASYCQVCCALPYSLAS